MKYKQSKFNFDELPLLLNFVGLLKFLLILRVFCTVFDFTRIGGLFEFKCLFFNGFMCPRHILTWWFLLTSVNASNDMLQIGQQIMDE